jgi:FkbM family methyltransferase
MSNYKSQIGQDKYVSEFFNNKRDGYFIELGATNGITLSNTYYLEKELDWKGICIEPNPIHTESLRNNRSCNTDTSLVFSESNKEIEFLIKGLSGLFSGITTHLDNLEGFSAEKVMKMRTKTLTEVMDEHKAPNYIDYLSLDTEGTELDILKGIDFKKYIFGYITVEHNLKEPIRSKIREFLYSKGYVFSRWNRFDDDYMHVTVAQIFAWSNDRTDMTPDASVISQALSQDVILT